MSNSLLAHQTPLCMGFSRQEYWSGLPFASYTLGNGNYLGLSAETLFPNKSIFTGIGG